MRRASSGALLPTFSPQLGVLSPSSNLRLLSSTGPSLQSNRSMQGWHIIVQRPSETPFRSMSRPSSLIQSKGISSPHTGQGIFSSIFLQSPSVAIMAATRIRSRCGCSFPQIKKGGRPLRPTTSAIWRNAASNSARTAAPDHLPCWPIDALWRNAASASERVDSEGKFQSWRCSRQSRARE